MMIDTQSSGNGRAAVGTTLGLLSLLMLVIILKTPTAIFTEGRFWMEEGSFFFQRICPRSLVGGFFYVHEGRLELPANVLVSLSRLAGLENAPLVTAYGSLALQSLPLLLLVLQRCRLGLGTLACATLVVLHACLPQADEVWANAINLHFHFSLLAALVLMLPTDQTRPWRWSLRAAVIASGLSGAPACVLAPLFVWRAWREKDKERGIQAVFIATAALLQLVLQLMADDLSPRQFSIDSEQFGIIVATQQFLAPLFGVGHVMEWLTPLRRNAGGEFAALPLILSAVAGYACFFAAARRRGAALTHGLVGAMLLVALALVTRRENLADMTYQLRGLRYFYAPNMLLLVLAACFCSRCPGALASAPPVQRVVAVALALWALGTGLLLNFPMAKHFASGPPWQAQIRELQTRSVEPGAAPRLDIWPTGMRMHLPSECLERCGSSDDTSPLPRESKESRE